MKEEPKNETKVWFNLWAVLGFVLLLGAIGFTYLHAEGSKTKEKQQEVIQRVTKLETQYVFIIERLEGLTRAVEKSTDKLDAHTKDTKRKGKDE